jgi:hypothetical protein
MFTLPWCCYAKNHFKEIKAGFFLIKSVCFEKLNFYIYQSMKFTVIIEASNIFNNLLNQYFVYFLKIYTYNLVLTNMYMLLIIFLRILFPFEMELMEPEYLLFHLFSFN